MRFSELRDYVDSKIGKLETNVHKLETDIHRLEGDVRSYAAAYGGWRQRSS